jgi:transcriptional regulator with XRE-family HTH domain
MQAPRLQEWRLRRALSQEELSGLAGVHRNTIARLEDGAEGHPRSVRKLAQALGVEPDDLVLARALEVAPADLIATPPASGDHA